MIMSHNKMLLSATLTLLNVGRCIEVTSVKPDSSVITDEPVSTDWIFPSDVALQFIKDYKLELSHDFENFHMSQKSGPFGPALWTSMRDLKELYSKYPETLKLIRILGGPILQQKIDELEPLILKIQPSQINQAFPSVREESPLRKLSLVYDKEGKTRIIAILDYWSQTSLKPLHDSIFRVLKGIKNDCTFHQEKGVKHLSRLSGPFYSIDLTSATDRFPIEFQKDFLTMLIGRSKALAWSGLLTSLPYRANWEPKDYYYRTGQPMGAYSSWAVFSLSHHLVVHWASSNVGKTISEDTYCLLGDDIVIRDQEIAEEYIRLLTLLGVSTSPMKTHVSRDTFEFTKRWFHRGEEITGFPLNSLVAAGNKYHLVASALKEASEKGFKPQKGLHSVSLWSPGLLCSYFEDCTSAHPKFSAKLEMRAQRFLLLPKSHEEAWTKVPFFLSLCNFQAPCHLRTAVQEFEQVVSQMIRRQIRAEHGKLENLSMKLYNIANSIFSPISDVVDQLFDSPDEIPLPLFEVIGTSILQLQTDMANIAMVLHGGSNIDQSLYERLDRVRLIDLDRVNPERAHVRIIGSRASWSQMIYDNFRYLDDCLKEDGT